MPDVPPGLVPLDRTNLTLADRVEAQLRDQIVLGTLGPGSRLSEGEIAATFGVSRGPVREALRRLAHRGLVSVEAHRGAFVRHLELSDVRELFEVRIALEVEAAALAAQRIDDAGRAALLDLERLADTEAGAGNHGAVFDDHDLHELVVGHAGNEHLARAVQQVNAELRLARSRSSASDQRAHEAQEEHRRLIRHLVSGDVEGARTAMRDHLTAALFNTLQTLQCAVDREGAS
jgi:DNA-binding GntR family transcriptional regulator